LCSFGCERLPDLLTLDTPLRAPELTLSDTSDNQGKVGSPRSLRDTIRKVRTAEAERSDVVVELRDAERARLELLADELKDVFAEVPEDDEQFIFTVAAGTPPRLWIDMTSFVAMGRDRRTYRFLKDTRLGRTVILESTELGKLADVITHYVAERIIERERALEGDWVVKRVIREERGRRREVRDAVSAMRALPARVEPGSLGWVVAAFMFGLLIGAAGLFAYAWVSVN
jgi:hypothetical protein